MRIAGRRGHDLTVGEGCTRIMGVVNVTPDSFSDGGRFDDPKAAIAHGLQLVADGADLLDIGGESTRPGYAKVKSAAQIERIVPVIEGLRHGCTVPIAVDTTRREVAAAALAAGADWVNDTSALGEDPGLADLVAEQACPIVLMHRFEPPRHANDPETGPVMVQRIVQRLEQRVRFATSRGIDPRRIILDPGLGFGTLYEDNLFLMADIGPLRRLPHPLLLGPSRKSFIGRMTGKPVDGRLYGTAAAVAILARQGVEILRVHDVAAMVDVVRVVNHLKLAEPAHSDRNTADA